VPNLTRSRAATAGTFELMKNIDRGAFEPSKLFVIGSRFSSPNLNPQIAGRLFQ